MAKHENLYRALAQVHPRFRTPASALTATTIPLILIGGGLELRG